MPDSESQATKMSATCARNSMKDSISLHGLMLLFAAQHVRCGPARTSLLPETSGVTDLCARDCWAGSGGFRTGTPSSLDASIGTRGRSSGGSPSAEAAKITIFNNTRTTVSSVNGCPSRTDGDSTGHCMTTTKLTFVR